MENLIDIIFCASEGDMAAVAGGSEFSPCLVSLEIVVVVLTPVHAAVEGRNLVNLHPLGLLVFGAKE